MVSTSKNRPSQLLALAVLGGFLLWGVMLFNGTVDALDHATLSGAFPDGRPLRLNYTGWERIDSGLRTIVAYWDVMTNKNAGAGKWLMFDTTMVVRTINAWVLIESRRRGTTSPFMRHAVLFWFLQNFIGAAVAAPLYLYCIASSKQTTRDRTIPLNEARAFIPTYLANMATIYLVFVPSWSASEHQRNLSLFQLSPIVTCIAVVFFSRPGTTMTVQETPKDEKNPNVDAPWVIATYYATGIISTIAHLATVGAALSGLFSKDLSLARLYKPSPSKVYSQPPGSYAHLQEGLHLFQQYDFMIAGAACLVFVHHMLQHVPKKSGKPCYVDPMKSNKELLYLAAASAVIGPAGAGSFGLAIREKRLRAELEEKKVA